MTSLIFPDVNVLLALVHVRHLHHRAARSWYREQSSIQLAFCRVTQMSLFRLLTTRTVVGDEVMPNRDAWALYDDWIVRRAAVFLDEPAGFEAMFRSTSGTAEISPKRWADAYVIAFTQKVGVGLVTFDAAVARRVAGSTLLRAAN